MSFPILKLQVQYLCVLRRSSPVEWMPFFFFFPECVQTFSKLAGFI